MQMYVSHSFHADLRSCDFTYVLVTIVHGPKRLCKMCSAPYLDTCGGGEVIVGVVVGGVLGFMLFMAVVAILITIIAILVYKNW